MDSADKIEETGKKIVALCGSVGLERGIDLALELVHARWAARSLEDRWAKSAKEFDEVERADQFQTGSFNYENTYKLLAHLDIEDLNWPSQDPQ